MDYSTIFEFQAISGVDGSSVKDKTTLTNVEKAKAKLKDKDKKRNL